jgi:hypothetical protein
VPAIVSVLLHDLVVGDRPATICGRERNPTWIESAIRARFVRDSFHNLSTGLPTGLPRHLEARRIPCRRDGQPSALPGKCAQGRDQRRSGRDMTADRGRRPPVCKAHRSALQPPLADVGSQTVMQSLARPRNERVAMGVCGGVCRTSGKHVSSALRDARAAQSAAGTHWQEPNHAARSVIRDPCKLHCACRSVTESIPS